MNAVLDYHKYKYFPYERVLALREVEQLLGSKQIHECNGAVEFRGSPIPELAKRLVYFSQVRHGLCTTETIQSQLERAASSGKNRQATRYSVHGLHEYKGKFNPQIVKAILNIFQIKANDSILDPFCGSGTTLVECSHIGANGYGKDINPLAIFLANTKLKALATPAAELTTQINHLKKNIKKQNKNSNANEERLIYLNKWFVPEILETIENLHAQILKYSDSCAPIFLALASNLLRDYSLQDPNDLRIRRRTSALPTKPFLEAFLNSCDIFVEKLFDTQAIIGAPSCKGKAVLYDTTKVDKSRNQLFDAAITSPPYATALPYIDTQRLSLVWLGLIPPSEILSLEATLIGSREFRGKDRIKLEEDLISNAANLPKQQHNFCLQLADSLGEKDGFRRQAMPTLLYRYFSSMQNSFRSVYSQLKSKAPYALVVGHNHTVLGGVRCDINTPEHLANLAKNVGWNINEMLPLQTYKRYGYHAGNAVAEETLILLRKP